MTDPHDEPDLDLDDLYTEHGEPIAGLMIRGPWDGSRGPRPCPDLRHIVVPARPRVDCGDHERPMVIYSACGDVWIFDRWMKPDETPMEIVFGVKA